MNIRRPEAPQLRDVKVFAHRGGRMWAPENTMAAFANSLELGVDGIELDVQRCATGELVVIHDEDLSRTTNGVGLVIDTSFDELRRLDAGSWFDKEFRGEKIPLLSEVLELIDGKCLLNIEVKNAPVRYENIEEELVSLLEGYRHKETLIISSFDHYVLKRFNKLAAGYKLAVLGDSVMLDLPAYCHNLHAQYYHPGIDSCREDIINECHSAGIQVNPWTVNGRSAWGRAMNMGVDGIVTDDPEDLMVYLGRASFVEA